MSLEIFHYELNQTHLDRVGDLERREWRDADRERRDWRDVERLRERFLNRL